MAKSPSALVQTDLDNPFSAVAEEGLNIHNEYRRRHGVPELNLSKELCDYAQDYAVVCAKKGHISTRDAAEYGENTYSGQGGSITVRTAVDVWYSERKKHTFGTEKVKKTSHSFCQVVWKATSELGLGMATNPKGKVFVVAVYFPKGGTKGAFVENVPPPLTEKKLSSPQKTTEGDFDQFAIDGLEVHNEYRRKHGVPDLKLNKELCGYAQEWADTCAKRGEMEHRPDSPYGENLFYVYSSRPTHVPTARDAVQEWYDEIEMYSFEDEDVNHDTLHFTQMIWKSCTDLGFAMAKNDKGETYVVAYYHPVGNYIGQFVDNVPRPLKK